MLFHVFLYFTFSPPAHYNDITSDTKDWTQDKTKKKKKPDEKKEQQRMRKNTEINEATKDPQMMCKKKGF